MLGGGGCSLQTQMQTQHAQPHTPRLGLGEHRQTEMGGNGLCCRVLTHQNTDVPQGRSVQGRGEMTDCSHRPDSVD